MPRRASIVAAGCALWLCCAAYAWPFVLRGWIAHDEGTIAQSAERVLQGEVPHRDFDEVYSGGLTYLHAGAMRLLGVNLRSPRYLLFAGFMAFAAAACAIAWRLIPGWGAIVGLAAAIAWSVPNYFASLPSWYTLFCATFGILAFLRFLDARRKRWLIVAGVCGGCSILFKITGVYYVAAGLLFLAFVESSTHEPTDDAARGDWMFRACIGLPAALSLSWLARQTSTQTTGAGLLQVFLPAVAVVALLVWTDWRCVRDRRAAADRRSGSPEGRGDRQPPVVLRGYAARAAALSRLVLPFLSGVALPLAAFLAWYWRMGALPALFNGVFVLPQRRLTEAAFDPPAMTAAALAIPCAALFLARPGHLLRSRAVVAGVAIVLAGLLRAAFEPVAYRVVWAVARSLPLVAVIGLAAVLARDPSGANGPARLRAALLVSMASFLVLVQLPYATPTYFCYAAPVVALAVAAVVAAEPMAPRALHLVVAIFFVAFAALFVNRSYGFSLGVAFAPYTPESILAVDRGGLRVPAADKAVYEELVRVLRERAAGGTIYAGPDCPEVYFLSGFRNPTRAFFDFLSPVKEDDRWMARLLDEAPVRAVVVNTAPLFSPPMDARAVALVIRRFPESLTIGRFEVRFR